VSNRYFSIGEVLALLLEEFPDVSISKIRFLESQGLIAPERTPAGYRKFTAAEIERLRFILREQKDNFLPLRVIRDRLEGESSDGLLRPEDVTDPSMPRGIRMPSGDHPSARGGNSKVSTTKASTTSTLKSQSRSTPVETSASDNEHRGDVSVVGTKQRVVRFSRTEVLESTEVSNVVLDALEKAKLVRPMLFGTESMYDEQDREIIHLANRLIACGIEPRHLIAWRLAAEREADLFEPIVRSRLVGSAGTTRQSASEAMDELISLGEELRTALLRSATKALRERNTTKLPKD
jgi:DNA-binding transcriptional MerR regulator